ncbi:MAG TPA: DMT family transporter [Myxococcaceae bacterium]|jgi:drug/metabolite transporter (DMT)-like permease
MAVSAPADRLKADGVLLAMTAVWGLSFVVVKDALDRADPFTWLTLRFLIGAIALTIIARRSWDRFDRKASLVLGVLLWLGFVLQTTGLQYATPSRSAFLTGLFVVLTPLVSTVVFRRLPRPASLAGVALAFAGTWWLTSAAPRGGSGAAPSSEAWLGDALTAGCALVYSIHLALTEKYAPGSSPSALVAAQLWVVCGLSALAIPFTTPRFDPSPGWFAALAYAGVLASAVGFTAQTWAQARTTAVRAALVIATEPIFAAAYSVAIGRETLGPREVTGGALILLGILVAEVGGLLWRRPEPRAS